jgi:hypothetical protein
MALQWINHVRCKIVIENRTIQWASSFNYLGFEISYCLKEGINIKLNCFYRMCGRIRTQRQKTLHSTQLDSCKVVAVPMLNYVSENGTINRSDKKKIGVS